MMIDFIKATKHLSYKDKLFVGHCKFEAEYASGWKKYWIDGCERVELWWNPDLNMLKLSGSIMYYWQGHNWKFSPKGFVDAINHIGRLIHISLWDAMIEAFEYGVIMEVSTKPKEYIVNHTAAPQEKLTMEEKLKDKGSFRWWSDSNVKLKMYDAGKNVKAKQGLDRKEIIRISGWNPDNYYLKWETKYLKPEVLNNGKGLMLTNLVNPNWETVFKEDLYIQYKRLIPMKSLITPTNKKDLSTPDIVMLTLAEVQINAGESLQEIKKMLYAKINSFPEKILSKADKDGRKRQIKALLEKIQEEPESKWDLSEKLEKVLTIK